MPRRPHQPDNQRYPLASNTAWSIDANGLTPTGQAEFLKHLGRQLQTNYQGILKEPTPDRFKALLERLEQHLDDTDDRDL
jgi:hypothetical protein